MDRVAASPYYQQHFSGLTPQQRHTKLLQQALLQQQPQGARPLPGGGQLSSAAAGLQATETDYDALRKHHRFLRGPEDDAPQVIGSWGVRLARRYYARLFKEYAIADLSRYRESKVGLRWRTQAELVAGKGQFSCGAKGCDSTNGLAAYEVNFAYQEAGQPKQALVKLCLCEGCAPRLNYGREKGRQYRQLGGALRGDEDAAAGAAVGREGGEGARRDGRDRRHKGSRAGDRGGQGEEGRQSKRRRRDPSSSSSSGSSSDEDVPRRQHQRQQQQPWDRQQPDRRRSESRGGSSRSPSPARRRRASADAGRQRERDRSPDRGGSSRRGEGQGPRDRGWEAEQQRGPEQDRRAYEGARHRADSRGSQGGSGRTSSSHGRLEPDEGWPQQQQQQQAPRSSSRSSSQRARGASPAGGGAAVRGDDRWQLEGGGTAGAAAAEAGEPAGGEGDGGRWELEEGELDDADIEHWLDSLFTAVA